MRTCKFCGEDISHLYKTCLYCNEKCKYSYYRDIKSPDRIRYNKDRENPRKIAIKLRKLNSSKKDEDD